MATEMGPTVATAFKRSSSEPDLMSTKPVHVAPTSSFLKRHLPVLAVYGYEACTNAINFLVERFGC
jgi:hypothetical protein